MRAERAYLLESLRALGLTVYDSQANYVFFKAPGSTGLQAYLAGRGILIRSCANYRGLTPEFCRVAVRLHEENELLIGALGDYIKAGEIR